ncbi:MAG: hypothetical protein ABI679_07695 [Gemmatimonadota bacterium]
MIRPLRPVFQLSALLLLAQSTAGLSQERYTSSQLSCARFRETVDASIATMIAGQTRREETGEDGIMVLMSRDTAQGLTLEAWFDSLTVFRASADGRLVPETDGVIGGRFRGFLAPLGHYTGRQVPFIPPEVAEVVHLAVALNDLMPELAPHALNPGSTWSDSAGLSVKRLADSTAGGTRLHRYQLLRAIPDRPMPAPDSTGIDVVQGEDHRGVFVWDPAVGLLRWDREITIRTLIPPGKDIRQAVRAKVVQHVVLQRLAPCGP